MYGSFDTSANDLGETPSDLIEYYRKASWYDGATGDASGFSFEPEYASFATDWGGCYGE